MTCKCDESSTTPFSSQTTGGCTPTQQTCMPSLLTPQAEQLLRGTERPTTLALQDIASLGAGLSATTSVAFAGQTQLLMPWVFFIDDFVAALASANLDTLEIFIKRNGATVLDIFGGRFGRSNASCVTACGLGVCVGPLDTITVVVKNISAAPLNAADTATLQWHPVFSGEDGFNKVCGPNAACGSSTGSTAGSTGTTVEVL